MSNLRKGPSESWTKKGITSLNQLTMANGYNKRSRWKFYQEPPFGRKITVYQTTIATKILQRYISSKNMLERNGMRPIVCAILYQTHHKSMGKDFTNEVQYTALVLMLNHYCFNHELQKEEMKVNIITTFENYAIMRV